jgi:putative transposase
MVCRTVMVALWHYHGGMSRFRLYPTPAQQVLLLEHCSQARFIWNLALEQRLMWRRWQGPSPTYVEQARQLTEARAVNPWLAAGSVNVQQQALRDHELAWKKFFTGMHGRPTWRKRDRHEGFRIVGRDVVRVHPENRRWLAVNIPKVGWVRFRRSRNLPEAKSYRVTRDRSGRWHIAFAAIPAPIPPPGAGEIVGVDRGVKVSVALSTGETCSPAGLRGKEAERLLRLQRRLARAHIDSKRRAGLKSQIARLKAREVDRRKDWVEKTSTDLARRFDVIRVEDLRVVGMTKSARGTRDSPGRNVRQKARLNRGILAAGWGQLATRLEHKAPGRVQKVPAAYTSQRCNSCKHVASENRKSQAVFLCVACGHQDNADVNAARNIAETEPAVGRTVAARGDLRLLGSMKREPQVDGVQVA